MDLFDIVPENFFSLLSSKNKRIYTNLLLEAFRVYEEGSIIGIEKKIVSDELVHFLDNKDYDYTNEDTNDDEADVKTKRELVNYALRRFEECGWIYIDVTNEYIEILNFTDYGITMCEALQDICPMYQYEGYEDDYDYDHHEYQGYIYTIYTLLNNNETFDYSFVIDEVIRNTKLLIRGIRKLDSRLKTYISTVFDQTEVKDLMENLVSYRKDFIDNGYSKLKMSDNINRYRLKIVSKLESYQEDMVIMEALSKSYSKLPHDRALEKANSTIDEMIDIFNSLDDYISEIDEKSKTYINSTIAKIKFLLSEDDNLIGKLNRILRYVHDENKNNHIDKALKVVADTYNLNTIKPLSENSLYFPRGNYKRNYNLLLDDSRLEGFDINADFLDTYKSPYDETDIQVFINENMKDDTLYGSDVITREVDVRTCMLAIYAILFVLETDEKYELEILDRRIYSKHVNMRDFIIRRRCK